MTTATLFDQLKRNKISGFVLFTSLILTFLFVALYLFDKKPWKVKDPKSPRFDVSKFDPNDYLNHTELASTLRALLKPGIASRSELDMIWCKHEGCGQLLSDIPENSSLATCLTKVGGPTSGQHLYWYAADGKSPFFGDWNVWVVFNSDNKISNLCADNIPVFNFTEAP